MRQILASSTHSIRSKARRKRAHLRRREKNQMRNAQSRVKMGTALATGRVAEKSEEHCDAAKNGRSSEQSVRPRCNHWTSFCADSVAGANGTPAVEEASRAAQHFIFPPQPQQVSKRVLQDNTPPAIGWLSTSASRNSMAAIFLTVLTFHNQLPATSRILMIIAYFLAAFSASSSFLRYFLGSLLKSFRQCLQQKWTSRPS